MADPTKYLRGYSFSGFQASSPTIPLPAQNVDNELENIEQSIGQTVEALKDLRRSDGKLKDGALTVDSLSPAALRILAQAVNTEIPFELLDAVEQAELARDVAIAAAGESFSGFSSRAAAVPVHVNPNVRYLRLAGYATPGDGGAALYQRLGNAPSVVKPWHFSTADGAWWQLADPTVNVKMFGAKGDGVADDTAALQAARDYLADFTNPPKLIFPAGVYKYATSPNWAISNAEIISEGVVRLRYTGTGDAVVIDSGAYPANGVANVRMGRFIVETSTGNDGVYVRAVHHSRLSFNVRGCTAAALNVQFAVCTVFDDFTASINEGAWYGGAKPVIGILLDRRAANEEAAYCFFNNPVVEGVATGADLRWALGNTLSGGTVEGCTAGGLYISPDSRLNTVQRVDFEANIAYDVFIAGWGNNLIDCDSDTKVEITATGQRNNISGGNYEQINILSGATYNVLKGLTYNRYASGGINNLGSKSRFENLINQQNGVRHGAPVSRVPITVGVSPFTYTNETSNPVQVYINGGTVSTITYVHSGVGDLTGDVRGVFYLPPDSGLIVAYTGAPTMMLYTF